MTNSSLSELEEKENEFLAEKRCREIREFIAEQDALQVLQNCGDKLEFTITGTELERTKVKVRFLLLQALTELEYMLTEESSQKIELFITALLGKLITREETKV